MTGTFELDGQEFMALNGGSSFTFGQGFSLFVNCETQDEVDDLWEKLSERRRDRVRAAGSRTSSASRGRSSRANWESSSATRTRRRRTASWRAMLKMRKIEIDELEKAAAG